MNAPPPYRTFSAFLRGHFGARVRKITLDAGLSCPHRDEDRRGGCIFCNARGSGTGVFDAGHGLESQITSQLEAMRKHGKARAFIAYFQSYSNTYAPLAQLRAIYDSILPFDEIVGLAIGTRPDCVDQDILELIAGYADQRLVWVEYGLQSANDATLARINRGHDVQAFIDAVNLSARYPLRICAHVIIGLPGEGPADFRETARLVSSLPVSDVKIHLLYVVKGTPLDDIYLAGDFEPLELEDYARATADFIAHLRPDIVVQRITGDPHEYELRAPQWALNKAAVRARILALMQQEGLVQGALYRAGSARFDPRPGRDAPGGPAGD